MLRKHVYVKLQEVSASIEDTQYPISFCLGAENLLFLGYNSKNNSWFSGELYTYKVGDVRAMNYASGDDLRVWIAQDFHETISGMQSLTTPAPSSSGSLLSRERPTKQNSVASNGYSEKAVDGEHNEGVYHANGTCIHSGATYQDYKWWMVQLDADYAITRVEVYNRQQGLHYSFQKMTVAVTCNPAVWQEWDHRAFEFCDFFDGPAEANPRIIAMNCKLPQPVGRFVTLYKIPGVNMPLAVCEIEVFGV